MSLHIGGFPVMPIGPLANPLDLSGETEYGIYHVDTIQRHGLGRRAMTWDGRIFKYSKSSGPCYAGQGAEFAVSMVQDRSQFTYETRSNKREIFVTGQTHDEIAKDALAGGYAIVYGTSNADVQFRGIVGNRLSAANADIVITLDSSLIYPVSASVNYVDVFPSPYSAVQLSDGVDNSKAGVPVSEVDSAGKYFWLQTWGPCWIACQNEVGVGKERAALWHTDGTLQAYEMEGVFDTTQLAGHVIAGSAANEGPLFMLQCSI